MTQKSEAKKNQSETENFSLTDNRVESFGHDVKGTSRRAASRETPITEQSRGAKEFSLISSTSLSNFIGNHFR